MSFDVVIPTLGKSPCLDNLITWLLKENPCNIFLVGNSEKTYKDVTFVKSRKGYSNSVNKAVSLCSSEYVLIVNDDIRPIKGSVQSLVKEIESDNNIFSVTPKIKTRKEVEHLRGATTGSFSPDYLSGVFLRGQRIFTSRHYRRLDLKITWWFFEILSQMKDLFTFRWKRLFFRWGLNEDSV